MRILHFYRVYHPDSVGGIETVINELCQGAERHGATATVLTLTRNAHIPLIEVDGHWVHRAKLDFQIASTGFSLSALRKFFELAAQTDIIHYHFPWPFMDVAHFLYRLLTLVGVVPRRPSLVTYHSDIIRQKRLLMLYRPLQNAFLASVDRIIATSPNYLATSKVLDRFRHKVRTIPYGLHKTNYPVPSVALLDHWRARLGDRFFLFCGVLRYYKGLHILMDALKGVDYPVVIIGAGPIEEELRAHALASGLTHLIFLGALSEEDKVALLILCYSIVFPSHLRSEAFGISLLEGAMYGKPLISSEIGTGTSYINVHGETGLVVPPSDPQAFRAAMIHLWENPEIAATMGAQAEDRYRILFTADRMVTGYMEIYHELLAGKPN
jgi:rhamnosyl/mannosyltransferase